MGPGPEQKKRCQDELMQQRLAALEAMKEALRKKEADLAEYRDLMDALDVNGCEGEIEKLQETAKRLFKIELSDK